MNFSSSKHKSGSESGWTMYLGQSSICSSYDDHHQYPSAISNGNQDHYLDLSMVSDASSGPNPYYHEGNEDQDCCRFNPSGKSSRKPKKDVNKRMKMKDKFFYDNNYQSLDDTASSHSSHNYSIQKQEDIYSSNNVPDEYSMESNARRQLKGKQASVKNSYSRSSIK